MAKLYCKIDSDIRAGLGVRGDKRIEARVLFSHSGSRTADGGVRVIASAFGTGYKYKVMRIEKDGTEEVRGILTFNREGR